MAERFPYGGQAVMEGVMMRGLQRAAVAVRAPDGQIVIREQSLNTSRSCAASSSSATRW
jgi:uncharacterized protein YqhQ